MSGRRGNRLHVEVVLAQEKTRPKMSKKKNLKVQVFPSSHQKSDDPIPSRKIHVEACAVAEEKEATHTQIIIIKNRCPFDIGTHLVFDVNVGAFREAIQHARQVALFSCRYQLGRGLRLFGAQNGSV